MKCLSVCQPHAWGIIFGTKGIENRTWPCGHRGLLAIQASKSRDWMTPGAMASYPGLPADQFLSFGEIIGVVNMYDCVGVTLVNGRPYAEGPMCFLFKDRRALERPIPWRGQQGLFEVPDHIVLGAPAPKAGEGLFA